MPQIFQVLRCYKCAVFQVHQTRKDNKWVCKLCGEKQSIKRHYGLGTSKECRIHVQKLNKMRGEKEEILKNRNDSDDSEYDENLDNNMRSNNDEKIITPQNVSKESKWSVYVDKAEETHEIGQTEYLNGKEVLLEIPQKRKAKRKYHQVKGLEDSVNSNDVCELNMDSHLGNEINLIADTNVGNSTAKSFAPKNQESFKSNLHTKSQNNTNVIKQHKRQHIEPEKIKKDSKWAQFIDSDDLEENENSMKKKCNKNIFDLCDDSEIDTILDF
ncbi:MRN complex-interacting protein [Melitaea cinxia]|uniref:MRN complex-interacting protein n=1 Tax=Melitaea cinxia TaxID=113334 RepID=UPI001E270B4C|nr:MRN complex-interacting protein [Melitaea cinxia]